MAFFDPKKLLTNPLGVKAPPVQAASAPVILPKPAAKPLLQRVGNTITSLAKAATNPLGAVATKAANVVVASPEVAAAFKARPEPSKALIAPANMDVARKQIEKARVEEELVQPQEKLGKALSGGAGQFVGGPVRAGLQSLVLPTAETLGLKNQKTPLLPQSEVGKFFLGEEPIYSTTNLAAQAKQGFEEAKSPTQFARSIGVGALPFLAMAADATPFGGEEKALANEAKGLLKKGAQIAEEKAPKIVEEVLPKAEGYVDELMGKKGSQFFNVKKLNVPEPAREAAAKEILEAGKQMEEVVGRPLTQKEVIAQADATSKILDKAVSRDETAEYIAKNLKLRQKLAADAAAGKTDEEFVRLALNAKSQATDIARKLNALKISADPKEVSVIDTILDAIYKQNQNIEEIAAAAKNVDFKDPDQVTAFYRQFVKPNAADWVNLLRYNSMLSSPKTHLINIVGNTVGSGVIAPIEKTILGGVDAIASALNLGKRERKYFAGEGAAYAKGYLSNVRKATQQFADVMSGKRMGRFLNEAGAGATFDVQNIPLIPKGGNKGARAAEKVLAYPMKLLEAADQFFGVLTEQGAKSALEYRASKGVPVKNIDMRAAEEAAYRLFRQPTDVKAQGGVLKAMDALTNHIHQLRNSSNPYIKTIAQFTLPFVRTPMNILKQGLEYSPLGVATIPGAENKLEQITKVIMGTAVWAGVAQLAATDRLTFAEPTKQDEKNAFRAAGMQPYALKVGNKWYSYAKLAPQIGFPLAFAAAIADAQKSKGLTDDEADVALSALAKWSHYFIDQSYVKNIGDFVSGVKGDENAFASYFSNYGQQAIPFRALMGWITRMVDPVQRRADPKGEVLDKQLQYLMTQIPGLSQRVPARKDQFGKDIPIQNPFLNAFSPVTVTTEEPTQARLYQETGEAKASRDRAVESMQGTYDRIQSLVSEGKQEEAQSILDGLSDDDYKRYKKLKAAQKAKETSVDPAFVETFYEIRDLVNAGKEDEAKKMLDALTDDEYKLYQTLKKRLTP